MAMRLLGIDYGTRRIGLALSDESGQFAFPYRVLAASARVVQEIKSICREQAVGRIVLGQSLDYLGRPNPVAKKIDAFKFKLAQTVSLPVDYEPEFLTSAAAARLQGQTPELDASAAALILKSYLERRNLGLDAQFS